MPPTTRSVAAGLPAGALDFSRSHEMPWQESVLRELTPTVTRVLTQSSGGAVDPRALLELPEPLVEVPELALDPVLEPLPRPRQTFRFPELRHGKPPAAGPHQPRERRHGDAAPHLSLDGDTPAVLQRQWCRSSEQTAPTGQSPTSALHTSAVTGSPRCRRSMTFSPNSPGRATVKLHVGQAVSTDAVLGFFPFST